MKNVITSGLIVLTIFFSTLHVANAQGTLYLSNGQTSAGVEVVAGDSWLGSVFRTGTNPEGYELNSFQVMMGLVSGNPSGLTTHIYSMDSVTGLPAASLATLAGSDPIASGPVTYMAEQVTLSPLTVYFVVLTAETPASEGGFHWSIAATGDYWSTDDWFLGIGRWYSVDGSDWGFSRFVPFQFEVYATPIPEPASGLLLVMGGVAFVTYHVQRRHNKS